MAKVAKRYAEEDDSPLYYPECPYAEQGEYHIPNYLCLLLRNTDGSGPGGDFWCSVANECGVCPFDLHEELYGVRK